MYTRHMFVCHPSSLLLLPQAHPSTNLQEHHRFLKRISHPPKFKPSTSIQCSIQTHRLNVFGKFTIYLCSKDWLVLVLLCITQTHFCPFQPKIGGPDCRSQIIQGLAKASLQIPNTGEQNFIASSNVQVRNFSLLLKLILLSIQKCDIRMDITFLMEVKLWIEICIHHCTISWSDSKSCHII